MNPINQTHPCSRCEATQYWDDPKHTVAAEEHGKTCHVQGEYVPYRCPTCNALEDPELDRIAKAAYDTANDSKRKRDLSDEGSENPRKKEKRNVCFCCDDYTLDDFLQAVNKEVQGTKTYKVLHGYVYCKNCNKMLPEECREYAFSRRRHESYFSDHNLLLKDLLECCGKIDNAVAAISKALMVMKQDILEHMPVNTQFLTRTAVNVERAMHRLESSFQSA